MIKIVRLIERIINKIITLLDKAIAKSESTLQALEAKAIELKEDLNKAKTLANKLADTFK